MLRLLAARACGLAVALALATGPAWAEPPRADLSGTPAPGGEPLLAASEAAAATVLGTLLAPTQIDRHGWVARLYVERVLRGEPLAGQTLRVAWEELARSRPARFQDRERVLVALDPLPSGSLWRKRFPERDAWVVSARGDAFLIRPDDDSIDALADFLALTQSDRSGPGGVEALAELVAAGQAPLARAALERLEAVPGLDERLSAAAQARFGRAIGNPERPLALRRGVLRLVERRRLETLRSLVSPWAAEGSPVRAEALAALAVLDDGIEPEQLATLLASDDDRVRAVAVRYAPGTELERELPELVRLDPAPTVRAAAVRSLLRAQGEQAIGVVSAGLFDRDPDVRQAATTGLVELGSAAVPTLEQLVERRAADEVATPLAALALVGRPGRLALERIAADHPDENVRAMARAMMGREPRPHH